MEANKDKTALLLNHFVNIVWQQNGSDIVEHWRRLVRHQGRSTLVLLQGGGFSVSSFEGRRRDWNVSSSESSSPSLTGRRMSKMYSQMTMLDP
eukprot:5088767-Ditylum_brightwellii.AAC.1